MYIERALQKHLREHATDNKAIVVLGARQVGKTTMLRNLLPDAEWYTGDDADIRTLFSNTSSLALQNLLGKQSKVVVIDEAQRIENIGVTAKIIIDTLPNIKLVLSGSSAFELANKINEPLTGRKWEFTMFPLSFGEMVEHTSLIQEKRQLEQRLIYGNYPDVVLNPGAKEQILRQLSDAYLYKDILTWENIQKPEKLERLLKALAFQAGSLVSYNELAQTSGLNNATVERYINLLEKTFIIFKLGTFTRNLRNELNKSKKIYFYDNGLRNAIVNDFRPLENRADKGLLWENYMIAERMKKLHYDQVFRNTYFWRTKDQAEIDWIEEGNGAIYAYEFKWSPKKNGKFAASFKESYQPKELKTINSENYHEWLI
jgi:hypothetical protein